MNATLLPISQSLKLLEWVQSAVQLIAPILILMTEKWATEQSCIQIEITSCKTLSLVTFFNFNLKRILNLQIGFDLNVVCGKN